MSDMRRLFASFRDSVMGLFDSNMNSDDLKGILWLAVLGVVVAVLLSLLRSWDNRKPMGR
jgi:diacylglycerol kinase